MTRRKLNLIDHRRILVNSIRSVHGYVDDQYHIRILSKGEHHKGRIHHSRVLHTPRPRPMYTTPVSRVRHLLDSTFSD